MLLRWSKKLSADEYCEYVDRARRRAGVYRSIARRIREACGVDDGR